MERTRKAREAKAKVEAWTVERAREWAEAKSKERAEISRVDAEARERAREEAKTRVREKKMLFRGQQRLPSRSDPRWRPREKI